ncbi:phage envelope protein [Flavobacteriaceae bacterium CRH]|nr:phage envelope protein [Flavobacteriaceae bacterium CRH]
MFTIEQIKEAHAKVKSGADFPNYIQDLIILGVKGYATFVNDGHVEYYGVNNYNVTANEKYPEIKVADTANKERFIEYLVMHQDGQTDYLTFCNHAAQCGIAKWRVDIIEMTCTYYDKAENEILIEKIPG